ncbi:MAG: glycosyltransferase family 39 protein, partial [Patescibacteria group bacterium]
MIHITYSAITAIALLFSLWSPLGDFIATPKFWRDEAIPFEIARTFAELGTLDVVVAPNEVDGRPYLTHATGFPLTIPLAGVFKVAGIGVRQARVFMIGWILLALWFLIFFLRKLFDDKAALAGALLVSTFAPFYANGRTFTGEIPGFLFLLIALYLIYNEKDYFWGGLTMALAAVTKPSIFLLVLPALALEFLWTERKRAWRPLLRATLGALPVMLVWLYIILPHPFSGQSWAGMIQLYLHPFNAPSILAHPARAAKYLLTHSTIIYFAFLSAAVIWAYRKEVFQSEKKRIVHFMFVYAIFSLMYFFRSPGWLRYLLISEIFVLMLVYPSLEELFKAWFDSAHRRWDIGRKKAL